MFTCIQRGMCGTTVPSATNLVKSILSFLHDMVTDSSNLIAYSQNYDVSTRLSYTSDNQSRTQAGELV